MTGYVRSGTVRSAGLLTTSMVLIACIRPFGCASDEASTPAIAAADTKGANCRKVERLIDAELPVSVTNCRYYSHAVGGWGGGMLYAYFELPDEDALALLDKSTRLPDARELSSTPSGWNLWTAFDENGAAIPWWQPRELQDRQFAVRRGEDYAWGMYICIGRTATGRTGVYIFYTAD